MTKAWVHGCGEEKKQTSVCQPPKCRGAAHSASLFFALTLSMEMDMYETMRVHGIVIQGMWEEG